MPTATTSRARGAARTTRGVTLQDLLDDNQSNNATHANNDTQGKRTGSSQHKKTSGPRNDGVVRHDKVPKLDEKNPAHTLPTSKSGNYPPPWQTLALESLLHVCRRPVYQSGRDVIRTSSPRMDRTASNSSSATIPLDIDPSLKRQMHIHQLQVGDLRQTAPARQPKLESESINGDPVIDAKSPSGTFSQL